MATANSDPALVRVHAFRRHTIPRIMHDVDMLDCHVPGFHEHVHGERGHGTRLGDREREGRPVSGHPRRADVADMRRGGGED